VNAADAAEPTPDDPFRYLEDAADPRTQEFFREQAARRGRRWMRSRAAPSSRNAFAR
jgi:hypothetical protein